MGTNPLISLMTVDGNFGFFVQRVMVGMHYYSLALLLKKLFDRELIMLS